MPFFQVSLKFYRFWCLKESFVKAEGSGLGWNLQRLSFHCLTPELNSNRIITDTSLEIDGTLQGDWQFEEHLLNINHWVSVALNGKNTSVDNTCTQFQIVDINDLLGEEFIDNYNFSRSFFFTL